jgi:hypothetical protein
MSDLPRVRQPTDEAREAARRWLGQIHRFTREPGQPIDDVDGQQMLRGAFGDDLAVLSERLAAAPETPLVAYGDPAMELVMPDELVGRHGTLCFARAGRLAEAGQHREAMEWFARGRAVAAGTDVELGLMVITMVTIGNQRLDDARRAWRALLAAPASPDRDATHRALTELVTAFDTTFAPLVRDVDGAAVIPLDALVPAGQLALRLLLLAIDMEVEASPLIQPLFDRIDAGLSRVPTHGSGWAMSALWHGLLDHEDRAAEASRKAIHYGAGSLLEDVRSGLARDTCVSEDAG